MKNNRIVTAKNVKVGLKVIQGRDWGTFYIDQDKDSDYGVIADESFDRWYIVSWMQNGIVIGSNSYRVGENEDEMCDLYFYTESLIKPEYEKEAQKFFKINNLNKITREMVMENKLQHFLTENSQL